MFSCLKCVEKFITKLDRLSFVVLELFPPSEDIYQYTGDSLGEGCKFDCSQIGFSALISCRWLHSVGE